MEKKQEQAELAQEAAEQKSRFVVLPAGKDGAGHTGAIKTKKRKKNKKKTS